MGIYRQGTKFTIREGKLTIFQKDKKYNTDNWYGRFFIESKQVEKSSKSKNKKDSVKILGQIFDDYFSKKRLKIKLIFTDLGDVISSDSLGSVFYQILSIMSEWYRKSLSEKQKASKDKLKKQGKYTGGKVLFSKDIGVNGVLVDCEKQKRELNLILGLRSKGKKYKEIKSEMEKYTGRKWHISFLHKLVQREGSEHKIS